MILENDNDTAQEGAEASSASDVASPVATIEDQPDEESEPEAAPSSAKAADTSRAQSKIPPRKSNTSAKVVVLVLAFLAGTFFFVQWSSTKTRSYNLTKRDMQVLFQEMVSPTKQQEIASNPEEKKKLVDEIKNLLAVAKVAENEGYSQRPEVQSQTAFQGDLNLNQAYRKKYPDMKVTDDQVNAYYQSHPNDFDNFVQTNPRFQQQAQGPQREAFKRQYGEFKVVADLARKEKLDEDEVTRLQMLLDSSQILRYAYLSDMDKNADKLVSDEEVDQYYNEHKGDFEEVKVRHVLVSTQPKPEDDAHGAKGDDKPKAEQPKPLSREEAQKKAQALLERARKGEDFAKLAKENSDDAGSKDKGGEYDFFPRGQMVPEFETAAFALKPGEISDLVETPFGFHIIKLEDRRSGPPANDPKVRQQIIAKMKEEKIKTRIEEIAKESNVVVPEDFDTTVKPADTSAPMVPGQGAPPSER